MKKLYIFFTIFFALSAFNGCESNNSGENKPVITNSNTKNEAIKIHTKKEDKEKEVLNKIGITTTNDGKIIIEPKKTQEFLENIAQTLQKEAKRIKEENRDIKPKDIGIEASQNKIVIDVNKTEKFLNKLSKDLEKTASELEKIFN